MCRQIERGGHVRIVSILLVYTCVSTFEVHVFFLVPDVVRVCWCPSNTFRRSSLSDDFALLFRLVTVGMGSKRRLPVVPLVAHTIHFEIILVSIQHNTDG